MTNHFHAVEHRAYRFASRLIAAGWPAEDIAAALIVEGTATSVADRGRAATVATLRELADDLGAIDGQ